MNPFVIPTSQYADFLIDMWTNHPTEVPLISGLSGVGKSEIAKQAATKMFGIDGWDDVRLATKEAPDIVGAMVPDATTRTTVYYPPDDMPFETVPGYQENGVLALDEMRQGTPSVLNACYSLVYDRFVGKHIVRKGWRIMAMCNTSTEMTYQERLPEPLRARLCHIRLEANKEDFVTHYMSRMPGEVTVPAFLNFEPGAFHAPDSKGEDGFPCPRTWVRAGNAMRVGGAFVSAKVAGYLGNHAGGKYLKFVQLILDENNKLSAEDALRNPNKLTLTPEQNELAWAHASRVASYVIQEINGGRGAIAVPLMIDFFTHKNWDKIREIGRIGASLVRTGCTDPSAYNQLLRQDVPRLTKFIKVYGELVDVGSR